MATWPDPRSIVVSMAFGATQRDFSPTYEVLSPGADENDPGPVRGPVTWERGRLGDAPETSTTRIHFSLNDPDGEFSRRNPESPRFGTLREGTPVRLAIDVGAGAQPVATSGVPRFAPSWDGEHEDGDTINPRVPIESLGLLALLGRDTRVLSCAWSSVGFYTVGQYVATGQDVGSTYFPLETSLASYIPGRPAIDGTFVATSGPLGTNGAMDMSGSVTLSGPIADRRSLDPSWNLAFAVKMTAVSGAAVTIARFTVGGETYLTVAVDDTAGAELVVTITRAGVTDSTTVSASDITDGDWHTIELIVSGTSASVPIQIDYDGTAHLDTLVVARADPDGFIFGGVPELTGLAQIAAPVAFYDDAVRLANAGETPESRLITLAQGLGLVFQFDPDSTMPQVSLGRWRPGTPMATVRDIEDADEAAIYEARLGFIRHRTVDRRYNQDPAATFAWADIPGAVPLDDDRDTYNVITASDPDGNFAIEEETDGPVGSNPDTGVGPRPLPITRNVNDPANLRHHAGWVLRKGTIDQPRYIVFLNLFSEPGLAADWIALDVGSRIVITGAPPQHVGPEDLDLIIEGERGSLHGGEDGWVELHCQPYQPYEVRVWAEESPPDLGDHMGRWATERHCAIRVAIDDNDTSVLIDPPIGRWTTTAADLDEGNYQALYAAVGGERMKVTAVATTACTVVAAGAADHDDNAAVTPADYAGGAAGQWAFVAARARGGSLSIADANYTYTLLRQQGGLYLWATLRASAAPAPTVTPSGSASGDTISAVTFGFASMPVTLDDLLDAIILATSKSNVSDQDIDYSRIRAGSLPGRLILLVAGKSDDWTSVAPPSGFTELVDVSSTTGNDQGLYVAYRIDTTPAGVTPGKLAVTGGAAAVSDSMMLALGSGFQTLTVERSANGVVKSHAAGAPIETVDPLIWAL